jgi:hypothetical protein
MRWLGGQAKPADRRSTARPQHPESRARTTAHDGPSAGPKFPDRFHSGALEASSGYAGGARGGSETAWQRGIRAEADGRTRTGDPFITSEVLYQLSYVGGGGLRIARRGGSAKMPGWRGGSKR